MLIESNDLLPFTHRKFMEAFCPFYREFKYKGSLPINRADARGAVFLDSKVFYNRIPKAANTTIVSVIWQLECGHELTSMKPARHKSHLTRPSELSSRDVRSLRDSFYKFVFARNPFTRVLSAYRNKIEGHRRQAAHFERWAKRRGPSLDESFADFCQYLAEVGLYEDPHWAPQQDCLLLPLSEFDYVGKIEGLSTVLPEVLSRAFRREVAFDVPVKKSTGASSQVAAHYGPREIEMIRDLYRSDFELFGYSPAFPTN